ncbi:hypothetical protein [Streptomyces sp. NPDC050528]|uniref:hypothetical protein n=1 Tax=unclassified Streptomyces TaxID=2593676 RepID=UPI0037B733F3
MIKPREDLTEPRDECYDQPRPELLGSRPPLGHVLGTRLDSPAWTRTRTCAVWLLVSFASGARVRTATVVERPGAVRKDLSEDVVRGCSARLVVAGPGVPEGHWSAFSDGTDGRASLVGFVLVLLVYVFSSVGTIGGE